ncbi:3-isopropylmalate dehydratase [candidate division KD3-62 bacterium DG_56]|uniref:3-isopropylmalate dehydratase large subunit n=1 Tax=candidate division KD3-62 bacterium DG_56 TaxID=1704032 RepID=A0A0S7XQ03_9BACT|nr:MAG: 3-isopropylmalate dehydratase [candidate division KD3-62 bacterium DG_56]
MGQTITQKILAAHAGRDQVRPGEFIIVRPDFLVANDITAPLAIKECDRMGAERVFDPDRIALVPDHYVPNRDIRSAQQAKAMRDFARAQNIKYYFEVGHMGIEHALVPDQGLVGPGDVVIGADSHTCTYGAVGAFSTGVGSTDFAAAMALGEIWLMVPESIKFELTGTLDTWVSGKDLILHIIGLIGVDGARYKAMEFAGEVIAALPMADRFTMCNMAIEAGGKSGIIAPDQTTLAYVDARAQRPYQLYASDPDAEYTEVRQIDCSKVEPTVAVPHLPENAKPVSEVRDVAIDQAVIGSCTNGRIEDLRIAAGILKGRQVDPRVRLIVIPATQEVYLQAVREGLVETFVDAGGAVSTPTCGPCLGGHMGVLAEGERAIATTNRNFVGRMGHPKSEVYLASPAVAAASAVLGRIASPKELCS